MVFRAHHFLLDRDEKQAGADRQTESLAALAVLLALVLLGLFLIRALSAESVVEDCLLSGRRNCDAVAIAHPSPALW